MATRKRITKGNKVTRSQGNKSQVAKSNVSQGNESQGNKSQVAKRVNVGGRPTKYRPEMLNVLAEYLKECKKENEIPLREDFAGAVGVLPDTLADWERANVRFSRAIKTLDSAQKTYLVRNSLDGKKKEATSIFLLKANHGMMETSRQEITGKDGKDLTINITAFTGSGTNVKELPVIDGEMVE